MSGSTRHALKKARRSVGRQSFVFRRKLHGLAAIPPVLGTKWPLFLTSHKCPRHQQSTFACEIRFVVMRLPPMLPRLISCWLHAARIAFFSVCSLILGNLASAQESLAPDTLTIGIISYSEPWRDGEYVRQSLAALQKEWPGLSIRFVSLPSEELRDEIRKNAFELVVASTTFFAMDPSEAVRPLATLVTQCAPNPNQALGATVVVRSDRTNIHTLLDLVGKTTAAETEECHLSLHLIEHEIKQLGYAPNQFFKSVRPEEPREMKRIADDVLAGRLDSGILRSCFLEDLSAQYGDKYKKGLKVLDAQTGAPLACVRSTPLYPGLILAGTNKLKVTDARRITSLLLSQAPSSQGSYWGISTDFSRTDEMLKSLQIGPYTYLAIWTPERIWKKYWPLVIAALILLLAGLLYGALLERQVRRRTRALKEANARQVQLEVQARKATENLSAMQRAGAVGQLSSLLAHELKQPLETIQNLSRGSIRMLEDDPNIPEEATQSLTLINEESLRASQIIDRVRAYGKGHANRVRLNAREALLEAVAQFKATSRGAKAQIYLHAPYDLWVMMDPIDFKLIVVNLIANAWDAAQKSSDGRVSVRLTTDKTCADRLQLVISDNGPALCDEAFSQLGHRIAQSDKPNGLGLGLMIIKALLETYLGSILFERNTPRGIRVTVILPTIASTLSNK